MILQESPLYREIIKVFSDGAKPVFYYWEMIVHANGKNFFTYRVQHVELDRDYIENYTDTHCYDVLMAKGDYDFMVFPFKDNLEVTVVRHPLTEVEGVSNIGKPDQVQRYRVTLLDKGSGLVEGNNITADNQKISNIGNMINVRMQLHDFTVEQLRMKSTGGIFRAGTAIDVTRAIMGYQSERVNVGQSYGFTGVDVAPGFNTDPRDHVILPQGIKITSVPLYVHENCGGIYSAGFGYYYQKGIWYIYPPFDLDRYNKATSKTKTLTVINIPKNRLPGVERTYRETDTQVLIIANQETKHFDNTEAMALNHGNGVRFTNADQVMEGFVSVDGNVATLNRAENNTEFALESRTTGLNHVTLSRNRMTTNIPLEKSKLAARAGAHVACGWENALPELVYPGMPVRYIFEESGNIQEMVGCLIGAKFSTTLVGTTFTSSKHTCAGMLTLYLDKAFTPETAADNAKNGNPDTVGNAA